MGDLAFTDALVFYRGKFPSLDSLGTGTPPATWQAELDQVGTEALDSATATSVGLEGGHASGMINFSQRYKLRALHYRRAELDPNYVNPYLTPVPDLPAKSMGTTVVFGYGPYY